MLHLKSNIPRKIIALTVKPLLSFLGKTIFKLLLVPGYKLFLFFKKNINCYLLNNPYLPAERLKNNFKRNTLVHLVVLAIAILVISNNLLTRDTYAEEFKRDSLIAKILTDELDQVIVEKPLSLENFSNLPSTETVLNQLAALKPKKMIDTQQNEIGEKDAIALTQGGEALIQPNITPFQPVKNSTAAEQAGNKQIITYSVKSGDTLSAIAAKFNLSVNTLLWENDLSLDSYIQPGDKLDILPLDGITYSVKSGDTLSAIAAKFSSRVDDILSYNNLESASVIKIRQKLIIPGGKLGSNVPAKTKSIYSPSAPSSSGKYVWPSISKHITQYYHWQHTAIDIGAKTGTPIYAIDSGRVEYAGWSQGYGYNTTVDHGGGVQSRYGHASKLYVKRGDRVEQGESMGEVGSTGWSTGPHIHLEIKINGTKVNPLNYF